MSPRGRGVRLLEDFRVRQRLLRPSAAAAGSIVGLAVPAAVIAGANGAISGWRRIYDWSCVPGLMAFVLDSTWALFTTDGRACSPTASHCRAAGLPDTSPELSERQNRHVHRRGFMPRKGFAITLGNVIGGAGDVDRPHRRRLVTDHEDVHCWQARWLGPLFPLLYVGWMVVAGAIGMIVWATVRRSDPFTKVVESSAYYLNPLEWWAYSRDDHWPPGGKVAGMGWSRPCCRPLREVRDHADVPTTPVSR